MQKGEPVTLTADVLDAEYKGVNDGRITARVTAPSGKVEDVPMEWTVEHDGEYRARFTPTEDGLLQGRGRRHDRKDGKDVGRGHGVDARRAERRGVLRRRDARAAAAAPGGRDRRPVLSAPATRRSWSTRSPTAARGITVVEERELWDMPIILLLLLG